MSISGESEEEKSYPEEEEDKIGIGVKSLGRKFKILNYIKKKKLFLAIYWGT